MAVWVCDLRVLGVLMPNSQLAFAFKVQLVSYMPVPMRADSTAIALLRAKIPLRAR